MSQPSPSRRHPRRRHALAGPLASALLALAALTAGCGDDGSGTGQPDSAGAAAADARVDGDGPIGPGNPDAGTTTATDPALDGTATVSERTATIPGATAGRQVTATVYTPSSPGPRPLVVISPGFQMARTQYASYARHLATWGFAVVLADYAGSLFPNHQDLAADVRAVITWALADSALAADPTKVATAGHSLGGKVSTLVAIADDRVRAVVAWDPVDSNAPSAIDGLGGTSAAIAVVGETTNGSGGFMPCAPAADNFTQFYAAAGSPALQMTMVGADHMDWVDDPGCPLCGFCTAGTLAPSVVRTASRRLDVAWLRRHLLADMAMEPWLTSPPEVGAGQAMVLRK
ncbi:MAG: alpha/beta hydrolase [Kofleriaceae bacterium]|nr:alpha/beta hydrolase [Kofleriaceae bacterium]